ncbi:MAG: SDR family NAD(P)-dependent oxidoreductase [Thermodesulfobacteriota bacterium]
MQPIRFDGRAAIVTGAGAGLGRSYAKFLASRGAMVLVNDLGSGYADQEGSAGPAQQVAQEIMAAGGRAVANADSVADWQGAQRMVQECREAFGRVDILINNAGILRDRTLLKMTPEDFQMVLGVHLLGAFYTTRAAFALMKEQAYGRIVLTTSTSGLFGVFGQTNYSAAKLGLVGFMNALKQEGVRYNVLVNAVAPMAATRLSLPTGFFPPEMEPLISTELVTPLVAWFCSEQCNVSGDVVEAGGGYFAKAQVVEGLGVRFDPRRELTPEMIAEHYGRISDMRGARPFASANEQMQAALAPLKEK